MKYFFMMIGMCFCLVLFSAQTKKVDTVNFEFYKSKYDSIAKNYVNKLIDINKDYKKTVGKNDPFYNQIFDGDINDLEIIVHPVFAFKTDIKDDDGKTNLIHYIDFKNDIYNQDFDIYLKREKKWMLSFRITKEEYFKIMDNKNMKEYFGALFLPKRPIAFFNHTNYLYLFRDNFSFYISDKYCALINNIASIVINVSIPRHIEIFEFNDYFLPELNRLKGEAQGIKNGAYKDYQSKTSINSTILNVTSK
ncbi:hypothetical protein [Chryseobacterium sp. 22458]|uniref:hypothetical protein n=1 Tax=Chryseobacterium sp. 22458 TaxID=3453921 RepID=UPI003F87A794